MAETGIDHDLVALGRIREKQNPDAVGQFDLLHVETLDCPG